MLLQDTLEYKKKTRTLKIRMLDDSVKTINVDDSHPVSQIMITICSRIGECSTHLIFLQLLSTHFCTHD